MEILAEDTLKTIASFLDLRNNPKIWNIWLRVCKRFHKIGKPLFTPMEYKETFGVIYDPLVSMCSKGNLEAVKYLLSYEGVNPKDNDNCAFKYAALKGHTNVVEFLLKDDRVDPAAGNGQGENTALTWVFFSSIFN